MKAFIVQFPFGVTAFDDKNQLVEKALFPKKVQAAAKNLLRTEQGKLSDQATSLITLLKNVGYDTFVFSNGKLAEEAQRRLKVSVEVAKPAETAVLNNRMSDIAVESGFVAGQQELDSWNRDVSMELSKLRIKGATGKRDLIVAQGIQTLDSLDQTVNLFMGRLREWYGIYFPELDRLVEKHETYARLAMNLGNRDNFSIEKLEAEGIPKERTQLINKAADASMGADISDLDLEQVQTLAKDILAFYTLRKSMDEYVDRTMEEMAPNVRAVAGALLGARMISIAGSLQNLAMRPASTIQVLGAEKALFRSLKTGARPPKHGLIFQHTMLHDAKRWQRGKIARVIAGKLAIAARADAFGEGHYIGDTLKEEINKRVEEIREKYKEPPPPKEPKPKEKRERFERRERGFSYREGSDRKEGEQRFQRGESSREGERQSFQKKPHREGPPKGDKRRRKQWRDKRGRQS
ncbi:MAG: C/D box methylation guide ribonucleoprotein complex aNOP56 subunit [Nitrososphaerota archaeon]|jgi:nucleolar protein 56|nr:C/D box methylation guide ribonucleoprotein complex aNOP56 subunit [Nitrososphaerota archaeon]